MGHHFARFIYLKGSFAPSATSGKAPKVQSEQTVAKAPLAEDAYYRESTAKLKIIVPRHNALSNDFCKWLKKQHCVDAIQERQRVDVRFDLKNKKVLAELKVSYGVGTTKSIREALGQLLEYNYYPGRRAADAWLNFLDDEPSDQDRQFVELLR